MWGRRTARTFVTAIRFTTGKVPGEAKGPLPFESPGDSAGKLSSAKFGSEKRFVVFRLEKKKKPFGPKVVVNRFDDDPAIARTFALHPILYRFDGPPRRKAHAIMNFSPILSPPLGIGPLIGALQRFSCEPPFTPASPIRSFPAFPLQAGQGFIFVTCGAHRTSFFSSLEHHANLG